MCACQGGGVSSPRGNFTPWSLSAKALTSLAKGIVQCWPSGHLGSSTFCFNPVHRSREANCCIFPGRDIKAVYCLNINGIIGEWGLRLASWVGTKKEIGRKWIIQIGLTQLCGLGRFPGHAARLKASWSWEAGIRVTTQECGKGRIMGTQQWPPGAPKPLAHTSPDICYL